LGPEWSASAEDMVIQVWFCCTTLIKDWLVTIQAFSSDRNCNKAILFPDPRCNDRYFDWFTLELRGIPTGIEKTEKITDPIRKSSGCVSNSISWCVRYTIFVNHLQFRGTFFEWVKVISVIVI
jgi:hypothetical protein